LIGKVLGNRFQILEQLGGGGMAIIYKGRDTLLNRFVTVKMLRPDFTGDEDFVRRFRREAQAVASLSHPNIVNIYDVGSQNDLHYLVMEYVEGDNLKNLIRSKGTLPLGEAVQLARQVLAALDHAHENHIVHRDVKPHNILITTGGRAKLTDFGIAGGATAATVTQSDTIVGSVHYLSPEQARGEAAGPSSDIYSLGVVLYEMVTGAVPYQGDSPISVALKHIQEDPAPPSSINPAIPPELERVIRRAMAKNPEDRYKTAGQMEMALVGADYGGDEDATRLIAPGEMTQVLPAVGLSGEKKADRGGGEPDRRRRPRWIWAVLALLGLMVAGAAAFQLYINVQEVNMPSVEGKTMEEARSILQASGFSLKNIQVVQSSHPTYRAGTVYEQDPPRETRVKVIRTVILKVSQGPETRVVPKVTGLPLNDARARIFQNDLFPAEPVEEQYSSEVDQGTVMDQKPEPEDKVTKGSQVRLTVSKGPQPVAILVPDLTGQTLEWARAELEKVKLKLDDKVTKSASTEYLKGQIIAQDPPKASSVQAGTVVKATVSDGPGPAGRKATVKVKIPDDGKEHQLRITVLDARGETNAYSGVRNPGERVLQEVVYFGKAKIQVYIDNELAEEKQL